MSEKELASRIIELVGGRDNVASVTHCVTRLRFELRDDSKADTAALESDPKVLGVVRSGGQYQVIVGNRVPEVYAALEPLLGDGSSMAVAPKRQNIVLAVLNTIAQLFTPLVPALAGGGIIKGLLVLAVSMGWMTKTTGTYMILSAASEAVFYFLPIMLAYTCAKRFKSDPVVGMVIAGSLLYPPLITFITESKSTDFLGLPVLPANYASSVIPIILAVWMHSYLEKGLNKVLPGPLRMVLTPAISLAIMVPLTMLVFGPVGTTLSVAVGALFTGITEFSPILAGIVFGGTYPLLVMFGMHRALVPIGIAEVARTGKTALWAFTGPSNFADAGSAAAVAIRAKGRATRSVATAASLTALCGITEPALYGVNLVFKRPMVGVLLGGAIGGAIAGAGGAHAYAVAIPSILTIPAFIGEGFIAYLIAIAAAFVVAFVTTFILGIDEKLAGDTPASAASPAEVAGSPTGLVHAPVTGVVAPLDDAIDPAFAAKTLGDGFVIRPEGDTITSPVEGQVVMLFPTNHAVGIRSDSGVEILIHVGVNTVQLQGKHFEGLVTKGDRVRVGDPLIRFEEAPIKAAGYSTETYVVVSNSRDYQVDNLAVGRTEAGQVVFEAKAKQAVNA